MRAENTECKDTFDIYQKLWQRISIKLNLSYQWAICNKYIDFFIHIIYSADSDS